MHNGYAPYLFRTPPYSRLYVFQRGIAGLTIADPTLPGTAQLLVHLRTPYRIRADLRSVTADLQPASDTAAMLD
jgi:hypothetical protein